MQICCGIYEFSWVDIPCSVSCPLYVNRLKNGIPLQRNGVLEIKSSAFGFV